MPASLSDALPVALRDAIAAGAVVLAPNERAAADLRARYNQTQAAAGLAAWEPAQIRSWNAWLDSLWSNLVTEGHESRLLLNPAQEHALWREIIAASAETNTLGSADSLADLAQSAWRLAASYEAPSDLRRFATTHDARTFATWAAAFRSRCERNQYLSAAELSAALCGHADRGTLAPPHSILLAGFDDDTPARSALLAALAERGCEIARLDFADTPSYTAVVRAENPQQELETAAHWLRHSLTTNPWSRIAVIVPQLADDRAGLDSTLRNVLAPELQSIAADLSSTPYAFSSGTPLAETAMAAAALDLLRWLAAPLPLEQVSALLRSPYLGSTADINARAAFDAFTLRQTPMLRPEIAIHHLASLPKAPAFLGPLATQSSRIGDARRSYADWMEFIRETLRAAAWPGDRPLNPDEFRNASTWEHALDAVSTLDFSGTRVDYPTALAALERQARSATAAHGSANASVQIMTPTEAAGSSFDALFFLRATDANWPPPERANPLLGWPLQHDRQMPGTDSAQANARAERATARLIASASTVLFFYSAEDETGPQRLSPLVDRLGWQHLNAADLDTPPPPEPIALDEFEDTAPLPPLTSTTVRGGAVVLKLQAACGFRAFAEMRLNATALETASPGLDPRQTGNFVHEVMDLFWREVETQARLRAMPETDRASLLNAAIEKSFARKLSPDGPWDNEYVAVQKERLRSVLLKWLEVELQRSPFTVTSREQQKQINVGPLTLSLRMDRVDQVEGVGTLLVDYKTGSRSTPADWEGERPDDPQLPLYALLPEAENLQGLAFAKIRPGKDMKWQGYGPIPKPSPMEHATIDEQIEAWRYVLENLARDFASGKADVSPKEYPFTCTHCQQRLICRLDVAAITADDEETEATDAE